jgi:hypothetical protein
MAWYGWVCSFALPILLYLWILERREEAILNSLSRVRGKGGGGNG